MSNSLKTQSFLFSRTSQSGMMVSHRKNKMNPAMQIMASMEATPENKKWQQGDDTFVTLRVKKRRGRSVLRIFKIVNVNSGGLIYVYVRDPTRGMDEKKRWGDVCSSCRRGILLNDEQIRGKTSICKYASLCVCGLVPIFWPCLLGYLCYDCDKRTCTSCNEVFNGEGCQLKGSKRKF